MTRNEFKALKKGDVLFHPLSGDKGTIVMIEHAYDYDTKPATKYNWKVHLDTGQNLQINDPIEQVVILEKEVE